MLMVTKLLLCWQIIGVSMGQQLTLFNLLFTLNVPVPVGGFGRRASDGGGHLQTYSQRAISQPGSQEELKAVSKSQPGLPTVVNFPWDISMFQKLNSCPRELFQSQSLFTRVLYRITLITLVDCISLTIFIFICLLFLSYTSLNTK